MTFITALLWIIPIIVMFSILVYGYVIVMSVGVKFLWVVKNCFSKKSKAPCMEEIKQIFTEDLFLTQQKYKNRSLLKMGFGLFFIVHLLFFLVSYFTYVNDDTKHHKAKAYYAVGAIPHVYSVVLGHITTPLHPAFLGLNLPITKIKEILFEKGVEYIPKDDAERELWEYEWFYYPYVIDMKGMWGSYVKTHTYTNEMDNANEKEYAFLQQKLFNLYEIMKAVNVENIADKNRAYQAKLHFPFMARYYYMKSVALAPYKNSYVYLSTNKRLVNNERDIERWLELRTKKIKQYEKYEEESLESLILESKAMSTQLLFYETNIMMDMFAHKFNCNSKRVKKYALLRENFLTKSVFKKLLDEGYEAEWWAIYRISIKNIQSEFTRRLLSQECHLDLPGHASDISFSNQLMDYEGSVYHEALQMLPSYEEYKKSKKNQKSEIINSLAQEQKEAFVHDGIVEIDGLEYLNKELKELNWNEAKTYCEEVSLNGGGWRLPNLDELQAVSTVKMDFFKNMPTLWFQEKEVQPYRYKNNGGLYFLRKEFLNTLTKASLLPSVWSSEEMDHPQLKEMMAYRADYTFGGISLDNKQDPLGHTIALCVRKNKIIEGNKYE